MRKYASCLDADERNRRVKTLSKVKAHKEYACEVHLLKTRMNKRARSAGCKSILPAFCTFCYGIFFHYSSKYTPILMHMKYKHGIVNTILNIYGSYLSWLNIPASCNYQIKSLEYSSEYLCVCDITLAIIYFSTLYFCIRVKHIRMLDTVLRVKMHGYLDIPIWFQSLARLLTRTTARTWSIMEWRQALLIPKEKGKI